MIKLLGKYHAYAPPFKYQIQPTDEAYIGGIDGRIPWSDDLGNQLKAAWDEARTKLVEKEWIVPSRTTAGITYTVTKMLHGFVCSCPARRGTCWHIKLVKDMDFNEDCDVLEPGDSRRTEEEKYGL